MILHVYMHVQIWNYLKTYNNSDVNNSDNNYNADHADNDNPVDYNVKSGHILINLSS